MGLSATDQISILRAAIGEVVAGSRRLDDLDELAARLGEQLPIGDEVLDRLWGRVELLLAEHSSGHLDDPELRAELAVLAPIPLTIGTPPRFMVRAATAAQTAATTLTGLVLGRLPADVHTQSVAVLV